MQQQLKMWNEEVAYPAPADLPVEDRPATRLREMGPSALSSAELLALVLGTNYQAGAHLLSQFEQVTDLVKADIVQLESFKGVGPATAARLKAAVELGLRIAQEKPPDRPQIRAPSDDANLVMMEMGLLEKEHLRTMVLDTKNRVLGIPTIYIGSVNTTTIRVGELFQPAIVRNAAGIIVLHNHPSGDPTPSPEDVAVTKQIVGAGQLLDIEVLDHLIIGQQRFVSLKERGLGWDSV